MRKPSPDTYIYKYNSVVVIVGAVNMLKTLTNTVNISVWQKDKPVKTDWVYCLKNKNYVDKKNPKKIEKKVINEHQHKKHIL